MNAPGGAGSRKTDAFRWAAMMSPGSEKFPPIFGVDMP
jgi:hypothetical protein